MRCLPHLIASALIAGAALFASPPTGLADGHDEAAAIAEQTALARQTALERQALILKARRSARSADGFVRSTVAFRPTGEMTLRAIDADPDYQRWVAAAVPGLPLDRRRTRGGERISYGYDVRGGVHAEVVALLDDAGNPFCTGSLITRDTVLTAAHCLCGGRPTQALVGVSTKITVEKNRLFPVVGGDTYAGKVEHLSSGDACRQATDGKDIALLKLGRAVPKKLVRRTARLMKSDTRYLLRNNASLLLLGFGETHVSSIGQKVIGGAPVINSHCRKKSGPASPENSSCVAGVEFVSSALDRRPSNLLAGLCEGDSGGPAYIRGEDSRLHLAGVSSRAGAILKYAPVCGDIAVFAAITEDVLEYLPIACKRLKAKNCHM